jgi:hypothetical protein
MDVDVEDEDGDRGQQSKRVHLASLFDDSDDDNAAPSRAARIEDG